MECINPQYMIQVIFPVRRVKRCHTKNRIFIKLKPMRAEIIPHDKLKERVDRNYKSTNLSLPKLLDIIENYKSTDSTEPY